MPEKTRVTSMIPSEDGRPRRPCGRTREGSVGAADRPCPTPRRPSSGAEDRGAGPGADHRGAGPARRRPAAACADAGRRRGIAAICRDPDIQRLHAASRRPTPRSDARSFVLMATGALAEGTRRPPAGRAGRGTDRRGARAASACRRRRTTSRRARVLGLAARPAAAASRPAEPGCCAGLAFERPRARRPCSCTQPLTNPGSQRWWPAGLGVPARREAARGARSTVPSGGPGRRRASTSTSTTCCPTATCAVEPQGSRACPATASRSSVSSATVASSFPGRTRSARAPGRSRSCRRRRS